MTVTFNNQAEAMQFKAAAFNATRAMLRLNWFEMSALEVQSWFETQARDRQIRAELVEPFALFCMNQITGSSGDV